MSQKLVKQQKNDREVKKLLTFYTSWRRLSNIVIFVQFFLFFIFYLIIFNKLITMDFFLMEIMEMFNLKNTTEKLLREKNEYF